MNADNSDRLRLFFALWPNDATRAALQRLQSALHGRLIPYANLHLTLAFLGQQPASQLPQMQDALLHLASPPPALTLDRLGYFQRSRIAWAGLHQAPAALIGLQQELAGALQQRGIAYDNRQPFKPHVTLARDAALPPDLVFEPIRWHACDVALVRSVTKAEGAVYEVVAARSLQTRCRVPGERGDRPEPLE